MTNSSAKILCFCFTIFGLLHTAYNQGRLVFPNDESTMMSELDVTDTSLNKRSPAMDNNSCYTEVGERGLCEPIERCPELQNFIKSRNGIRTPGTAAFLRKRICRFVGRDVHLCCVQDASLTPSPPSTVFPPGEINQPKPFDPYKKLPPMDECGLNFVVKVRGGKVFTHGKHPWLVGVGYPSKNKFTVKCGGTLITKKHVITAAHCFEKEPNPIPRIPSPDLTHVILGEHSLSKETEKLPPVVRKIASMIDPGYNATIHYNDIALITLNEEVQYSPYISPACLPSYTHLEYFDLVNKKMTVAGWGRTSHDELNGTDEPLEASLSLVSKPKCREDYDFAPNVPLDKTQICLLEDEKDACKGDSGGPLIYSDTKKYGRKFVIGVVAFGVECGNPLYPGVYTFVPAYADWIVENL